MMFSELGRDTSKTCIMFEYLSQEVQEKILRFNNVTSPYEVHFDVLPVAQLPYGSISDFSQEELDLQALTQIGYFRPNF